MNTKTPLAAALLLMASAASAQPLMPLLTGPGSQPNPAPFGEFQFLGNSPDVDWASPDCTHIPCNTKDSLMQAETQKAVDKAIADQKKLTPDAKIVDLGDGRFAVDHGNGMVSIDAPNFCGIPIPMSPEVKAKFAAQDAKETAAKEKKAAADEVAKKEAAMWNKSSGGGGEEKMKMSGDTVDNGPAPQTPPDRSPITDKEGGTTEDVATINDAWKTMSDDGGDKGSGGPPSPGGNGQNGGFGQGVVGKIAGSVAAEEAKRGLTYKHLQDNEQRLNATTASALRTPNGVFAMPSANPGDSQQDPPMAPDGRPALNRAEGNNPDGK